MIFYHIISCSTEVDPSCYFEKGTKVDHLYSRIEQLVRKICSSHHLQYDLLLGNGVIHVLDNVLNPSAATREPDPILATQKTVLQLSIAMNFTSLAAPFTTYLPHEVIAEATSTDSAYAPTSASSTAEATPIVVSDPGCSSLEKLDSLLCFPHTSRPTMNDTKSRVLRNFMHTASVHP